MSDYMYLFRAGEPQGSPEEMQQYMQKWAAWTRGLATNGHLRGGDPLDKGGKVVFAGGKTITDGPFAETKDIVGGYMLIEAEDLAQATELSTTCPIFDAGGSVEIRPILKMTM